MKAIILTAKDKVAAVAESIKAGDEISIDEDSHIKIIQDIPGKHKVALNDIEKGGKVVRYGEAIGTAKEKIPAGQKAGDPDLLTMRWLVEGVSGKIPD